MALLLSLNFNISLAQTTPTLIIEVDIASGKQDIEVAVQVFHEGKSVEDIIAGEDMSDVILWQGQTTTTKDGYFCFEFIDCNCSVFSNAIVVSVSYCSNS